MHYNKIMRSPNGIKPQDILVLLELAAHPRKKWRLVDLGGLLGLSQSEVSMALLRAAHSGLLDAKRAVLRSALAEFLIHGLRYVFPARPGPLARGVPTAHSAPPLSADIRAAAHDHYVWPDASGALRGQTIAPLYPSAPAAAKKDPALHQWLALVDALRVGRARDKALAERHIRRRLGV